MTQMKSKDSCCDNCILLKRALNRQSEIEKQLHCAIEITTLGLWEWSFVDNTVVLSDEIFDIIGFKREDIDGTMMSICNTIIHPDYRESFKASVESASKEGVVQNSFYRVAHPGKKECWIKVYSKLIFDDKGEPIKIVGTLFDITEDYLFKKDLNLNLKFLESLIEVLPNPIFYKDYMGVYRFCNSAFLNYLGKAREEVIGHDVYDVVLKELADVYHKADIKLMESQGYQTYETNVQYSDGSLHDVIFSKAAYVDSNGVIIGLVGVMQDITEKRIIEREVEMLYNVKDAFLVISKGIMIYQNEKEFFKGTQHKLQSVFAQCQQSTVFEVRSDETLQILTTSGFDELETSQFSMKLKDSVMWADTNGCLEQAHIINDISRYISSDYKEIIKLRLGYPIQSALIIPLHVEGVLKWIISFDSKGNHVYSEADRIIADYIREELPIIYKVFELHQKTLQLSRYDGHTGLMNRRYFDLVIDEKLEYAKRHEEKVIIVLFDLDGLKKVNDNYGHCAGDVYIENFVNLIKVNFDGSNCFARIGGDEFTGIFLSVDIAELINKIQEVRVNFEAMEMNSEGNIFKGSFSYGISIFPDDDCEKSPLMRIADSNMYKDKQRHVNPLKI